MKLIAESALCVNDPMRPIRLERLQRARPCVGPSGAWMAGSYPIFGNHGLGVGILSHSITGSPRSSREGEVELVGSSGHARGAGHRDSRGSALGGHARTERRSHSDSSRTRARRMRRGKMARGNIHRGQTARSQTSARLTPANRESSARLWRLRERRDRRSRPVAGATQPQVTGEWSRDDVRAGVH